MKRELDTGTTEMTSGLRCASMRVSTQEDWIMVESRGGVTTSSSDVSSRYTASDLQGSSGKSSGSCE